MYADFAQAHVDRRHVITSVDSADVLAADLFELIRSQSIVRSVDQGPG